MPKSITCRDLWCEFGKRAKRLSTICVISKDIGDIVLLMAIR